MQGEIYDQLMNMTAKESSFRAELPNILEQVANKKAPAVEVIAKRLADTTLKDPQRLLSIKLIKECMNCGDNLFANCLPRPDILKSIEDYMLSLASGNYLSDSYKLLRELIKLYGEAYTNSKDNRHNFTILLNRLKERGVHFPGSYEVLSPQNIKDFGINALSSPLNTSVREKSVEREFTKPFVNETVYYSLVGNSPVQSKNEKVHPRSKSTDTSKLVQSPKPNLTVFIEPSISEFQPYNPFSPVNQKENVEKAINEARSNDSIVEVHRRPPVPTFTLPLQTHSNMPNMRHIKLKLYENDSSKKRNTPRFSADHVRRESFQNPRVAQIIQEHKRGKTISPTANSNRTDFDKVSDDPLTSGSNHRKVKNFLDNSSILPNETLDFSREVHKHNTSVSFLNMLKANILDSDKRDIPERGSSVRTRNHESDWLSDQNKELRRRIEILEEKLKSTSPPKNFISKNGDSELDLIKKENRQLNDRITLLETQLDDERKRAESPQRKLIMNAGSPPRHLEEALKALTKEKQALEAENKNYREKLETLTDEGLGNLASIQNKVVEELEKKNNNEQRLKNLEDELSRNSRKLKEIISHNQDLKRHNKDLSTLLENEIRASKKLEHELTQKEGQINDNHHSPAKMDELKFENIELKKNIDDLRRKLKSETERNKELSAELRDSQRDRTDEHDRLRQSAQQELAELSAKNNDLTTKFNDLKDRLNEQIQVNLHLKDTLKELENSQSKLEEVERKNSELEEKIFRLNNERLNSLEELFKKNIELGEKDKQVEILTELIKEREYEITSLKANRTSTPQVEQSFSFKQEEGSTENPEFSRTSGKPLALKTESAGNAVYRSRDQMFSRNDDKLKPSRHSTAPKHRHSISHNIVSINQVMRMDSGSEIRKRLEQDIGTPTSLVIENFPPKGSLSSERPDIQPFSIGRPTAKSTNRSGIMGLSTVSLDLNGPKPKIEDALERTNPDTFRTTNLIDSATIYEDDYIKISYTGVLEKQKKGPSNCLRLDLIFLNKSFGVIEEFKTDIKNNPGYVLTVEDKNSTSKIQQGKSMVLTVGIGIMSPPEVKFMELFVQFRLESDWQNFKVKLPVSILKFTTIKPQTIQEYIDARRDFIEKNPKNFITSQKIKLSDKILQTFTKNFFGKLLIIPTEGRKGEQFMVYGAAMMVDDVRYPFYIRVIVESNTSLALYHITFEEGFKKFADNILETLVYLSSPVEL